MQYYLHMHLCGLVGHTQVDSQNYMVFYFSAKYTYAAAWCGLTQFTYAFRQAFLTAFMADRQSNILLSVFYSVLYSQSALDWEVF